MHRRTAVHELLIILKYSKTRYLPNIKNIDEWDIFVIRTYYILYVGLQ